MLSVSAKQECEEFSSFFPELVDTLTNIAPWNEQKDFKEKLRKILEYNVNFFTNARGVGTVMAYKALEKPENLTQDNIKLAVVVGWCGRLVSASMIVPLAIYQSDEREKTSPQILAIIIGQEEDAKSSLIWLRGEYEIDKAYAQLKSDVDRQMSEQGTWKYLFFIKTNRKALTVAVVLRSTQQLGGPYSFHESAVLINDDIIDRSETRGHLPCWYKNEEVGLRAINDAVYLENGIYVLLKKYFSTHPLYQNMVDLFHDLNFKSSLGQSFDMMAKDLTKFNMNFYDLLVEGKSGRVFCFVPAVMRLANYPEETITLVIPLMERFAMYYQIQNDYLDCFGDPNLTGKIGKDIENGSCSWLAVKALEKANEEQGILMKQHYGRDDQKSVEVVQNLYRELNIEEEYRTYEKEIYWKIRQEISELPEGLNHEFFVNMLDGLFNEKWLA